MEMCIDDPRTGFSSLFSTHPSVDARVAALVQFAGGHDPGPLALEPPEQPEAIPHGPWNQDTPPEQPDRTSGPWGTPPKPGPWG
jgi:heat shock protein HtpX